MSLQCCSSLIHGEITPQQKLKFFIEIHLLYRKNIFLYETCRLVLVIFPSNFTARIKISVILCTFTQIPDRNCSFFFFFIGRKNSSEMDSSRGHSVPQIYISQWCVELRNCYVGSNVLWRTALLGHVKSRCRFVWLWVCACVLVKQKLHIVNTYICISL